MKFKNPFKSDIDAYLSAEEENSLYAKAANDIDNEIYDKGIWTKAYAEAEGDKSKQKAIYIDLIVNHYKIQLKAGAELRDILATKEVKERRRQAKIKIAKEEAERPIRERKEAQKKAQSKKEEFIKKNSKEEFIRQNSKEEFIKKIEKIKIPTRKMIKNMLINNKLLKN